MLSICQLFFSGTETLLVVLLARHRQLLTYLLCVNAWLYNWKIGFIKQECSAYIKFCPIRQSSGNNCMRTEMWHLILKIYVFSGIVSSLTVFIILQIIVS